MFLCPLRLRFAILRCLDPIFLFWCNESQGVLPTVHIICSQDATSCCLRVLNPSAKIHSVQVRFVLLFSFKDSVLWSSFLSSSQQSFLPKVVSTTLIREQWGSLNNVRESCFTPSSAPVGQPRPSVNVQQVTGDCQPLTPQVSCLEPISQKHYLYEHLPCIIQDSVTLCISHLLEVGLRTNNIPFDSKGVVRLCPLIG